jgi:hypothetical protein
MQYEKALKQVKFPPLLAFSLKESVDYYAGQRRKKE